MGFLSTTVGDSKRKPRSRPGVAAVEMALVLPFLLFIVLLVSDFGRIFYTAITLTNAARAGAAYGAQSPARSVDSAGIRQAATQEAQDIGLIGVSTAPSCSCPGGALVNCISGNCGAYGIPRLSVTVTATTTFTTMVNYPLLPHTVPLSRTASIRVQ